MHLAYIDLGPNKSGTQFSVLTCSVQTASITKPMQSIMAKDGERWDGHMHHPFGPARYEQRGRADSLDQAKADVERMLAMWLDAAGLVQWRW
jgi:hypothetical protein